MEKNIKLQEEKNRQLWKWCEVFSLALVVHFASSLLPTFAEVLPVFREGYKGTGEMLTILFMIITMALNIAKYCPCWYLTLVALMPRAETSARAENTGCVLEASLARQPVAHGLRASSLRTPAPGATLAPGTPSVYILHIPQVTLLI